MTLETPVTPPIQSIFLSDGGQTAAGIAEAVAGFIEGAQQTLEIAIYDMRLTGAAASRILAAVHSVNARGVRVRVVFNQDHARHIPVPAPPEVDWDLLKRFGVPFHPISGVPDLMHHKYVVRDAGAPEAEVLTGSANWTDDSWTREENVILRVRSAGMAAAYLRDFEDLWEKREVAPTGHFDTDWSEVVGAAGPIRLRPFFCPGRGPRLVSEMSHRLSTAQRRVRICSPVLTAGPLLATLTEMGSRPGLDIAGVYDLTQMSEVQRQWSEDQHASWKLDAFRSIDRMIPFAGKRSTPYAKGSVHDFMHAKILVVDDAVFTGSYNLSHSGEMNAENVLEMENAALADGFAAFIDRIIARYPRTTPVETPS